MNPPLATVEIDLKEAHLLLGFASSRAAEVDRMIRNLEEAEGMDADRWRMLRHLKAEREAFETLVVKLEAAAREIRSGGAAPARP
ncbi:MAG TPA: hypothetical protein VM889_12770 [Candidatus Thermoplasmatota archaeon]|nr:hypothetical protein [Candidatus Thermoplasmatota archaeon]